MTRQWTCRVVLDGTRTYTWKESASNLDIAVWRAMLANGEVPAPLFCVKKGGNTRVTTTCGRKRNYQRFGRPVFCHWNERGAKIEVASHGVPVTPDVAVVTLHNGEAPADWVEASTALFERLAVIAWDRGQLGRLLFHHIRFPAFVVITASGEAYTTEAADPYQAAYFLGVVGDVYWVPFILYDYESGEPASSPDQIDWARGCGYRVAAADQVSAVLDSVQR